MSAADLLAEAGSASPAKPWPSFDWADPMLIELELTPEERMVRDTARAFAEQHLAPIVKQSNRHETSDPALMKAFGEAGLLGPTIKGYGCAGVSYVAYGLIAREIEGGAEPRAALATVLAVWAAARIYKRTILNNGSVTKWSQVLRKA